MGWAIKTLLGRLHCFEQPFGFIDGNFFVLQHLQDMYTVFCHLNHS